MKNSFLAFCFIASIGKAFTQTMVPFSSEQWQFYGEGYILEDYQNKTCVKLDDGGAILKAVPFFNGIIGYDVSFTQGRGQTGITFDTNKAN